VARCYFRHRVETGNLLSTLGKCLFFIFCKLGENLNFSFGMSSRSSPPLSPLSAIPEELSISYFPEESDRKVDTKLQQALESIQEAESFKQSLSNMKKSSKVSKTLKEKNENYGMEGDESVTSISVSGVPGVLNLKLNIEEEF
jgi:hypothetical protein